MSFSNCNSNIPELDNDRKALRITCLLGGFLSPTITIVWFYAYPGLYISKPLCIASTILFFLIYILSFTSSFVRDKAGFFLYGICFTGSIAAVFPAYMTNFSEARSWLLILVIFGVILVIKKVSHLLVYLASMLSVTIAALYSVRQPGINRENWAAVFIMFCLVGYIHMKTKIDTQKALKESEEHYRNLVEISPQAIVVHQGGRIVYVNSMMLELTGASKTDELIGKPIAELIRSGQDNCDIFAIRKTQDPDKASFIEQKLTLPDGTCIEVEANSIGVVHQGKPAVMSILKDITDRKKTERQLREAESRYRSLVESALVGVYLFQDGHIIYANPYLERILGYSMAELNRIDFMDLIHPDDKTVADFESLVSQNQFVNHTQQLRIIRKDGSTIHIEIHATIFTYNFSPALIGTALDVTHQKKAEAQIKHMAFHDALTGLPNRHMLKDYLNQALCYCSLQRIKLGIMFIDLDRFKIVNDTLGHNFGDLVLQKVADRLNRCVRKGDLVCRHGGDEFVIVLSGSDQYESAQIALRIISALSRPLTVNGHEVFSSPSIGISFYPNDGDDAETLVKNADSAMYHAKERGRNNYQFFTPELNETVSRKMELENGLRRALTNRELVLYYQPHIDLKSGKIAGLEALIRWRHPGLGLVSPLDFIPLAEETGLIIPIGEWVLETACMQNKAWQESGLPSIPIAVNVSRYQFQHSDFVKTVKRILGKTKLDPQYLVIEITESVMQDIALTSRTVRELKSLGVRIAVDDFGIGYSSLILLKNLTIDILKIDPSFIKDLTTNSSTAILIKFIIDLGHALNYCIIAEGIENEHEAAVLEQNGCDWAQGFYFSKPLPCEKIEMKLLNPGSII